MMAVRHRQYLADNLWLISHEEQDGKRLVSPLALGLGLAGALLAELVEREKLTVVDGKLTFPGDDELFVKRHPTPIADDALADSLLRSIIRETSKPRDEQALHVSAWLNSLSGRIEPRVAKRLRDQGVIEQFEIRKMFFKVELRHRVRDLGDGFAPAANLRGRLRHRETVPYRHVAMAGFAKAIGLDRHLLRDTPDSDQAYLDSLLRGLPPPLKTLIAETDAAVGNAVLTHRG